MAGSVRLLWESFWRSGPCRVKTRTTAAPVCHPSPGPALYFKTIACLLKRPNHLHSCVLAMTINIQVNHFKCQIAQISPFWSKLEPPNLVLPQDSVLIFLILQGFDSLEDTGAWWPRACYLGSGLGIVTWWQCSPSAEGPIGSVDVRSTKTRLFKCLLGGLGCSR